jgi:hypothetical protein
MEVKYPLLRGKYRYLVNGASDIEVGLRCLDALKRPLYKKLFRN